MHMNKTNGNVLFLILIAVALFAALSYAVTTSTRSGGGNADNEKTGMIADQILQYVTSIKITHDRIKIAGGYDQVRFSVLNGSEANLVYASGASSSGNAGGVFDPLPAGGGLGQFKFPASWRSTINNDVLAYTNQVIKIGSNHFGTSATDEYVQVRYLTRSICEALNLKLTGSKTISNITFAGSSGQANQFMNNDNNTINAMSVAPGGAEITLPDLPICAYYPVGTYYIFYYGLVQH